jgi:hypothetical protein
MKHVIRPIPLILAFAVLGTAIAWAARDGMGWWVIAVTVVGPDLSFLAAIGAPQPARGLMPKRVVRPYNLLHHPAGPITALAVGLLFHSPPAIIVSLTWASHLLWDRGVGYGLRAADGSIVSPQGAAGAPRCGHSACAETCGGGTSREWS